ncbi:MAG: TetR/AcrR family transcriptional regulator [Acidimicrobiales bacterium]
MSPASSARTQGPSLDSETLVVAAANLADAEGWSGLTLSRIAESVDRHVSSMYSHVDNLEALRREIALLAVTELADVVWEATVGRSGAEALAALAKAELGFARTHPGRMAALRDYLGADDPAFRDQAQRIAKPIRTVLKSYGLNEQQVAVVHRVFSATVRGLVEPSMPLEQSIGDATMQSAVALFVTALEGGTWPKTETLNG